MPYCVANNGAWVVMSCPYMGLYISMTNTSGPAITQTLSAEKSRKTSKITLNLLRKF